MLPQHRDPIFKGAKDPATMFGVPTVPFILVVGLHLLVAIWVFLGLRSWFVVFLCVMSGIFCILSMRHISSDDPHRLNQWMLRLRSYVSRRNKGYWGAASRSPIEYERRKVIDE